MARNRAASVAPAGTADSTSWVTSVNRWGIVIRADLPAELPLAGFGEESIRDQVVRSRAVLLDDGEQAMVIGEEEAFGGDEPAGAAAGAD